MCENLQMVEFLDLGFKIWFIKMQIIFYMLELCWIYLMKNPNGITVLVKIFKHKVAFISFSYRLTEM
jgi:hypothetical protein